MLTGKGLGEYTFSSTPIPWPSLPFAPRPKVTAWPSLAIKQACFSPHVSLLTTTEAWTYFGSRCSIPFSTAPHPQTNRSPPLLVAHACEEPTAVSVVSSPSSLLTIWGVAYAILLSTSSVLGSEVQRPVGPVPPPPHTYTSWRFVVAKVMLRVETCWMHLPREAGTTSKAHLSSKSPNPSCPRSFLPVQ